MQNNKKANSVRSLVNLYTVVIGVALSLAVVGLVDPQKGLQSVTLSSALLFLSFVVTLFPFYHGALRHLDDAYLENENSHIKDGALVVDFMLLFFHGLGFVILSLLLQNPAHFAWVLIVLLGIDVVWGVFVHFGSSSISNLSAEAKWTLINLIFVLVGGWYLVAQDIYLSDLTSPIKLSLPILIACTLRTLADYISCRSFYFPK